MPSPSLAFLRSQSDERLVALAQAGHEQAFEAIVRRYRRPLLRHGRRLLEDGQAEDAVQQALLSAWAGLRRGDDVRSLRPWLHTIVHNTALNLLRANAYEHAELSQSLSTGEMPHEELERRLSVRRTLEDLAALPERQRTALVGMALEGRSQDEMAHDLGLSQGALRQLVHRARTALRAAATALTPTPAATWLAAVGARSEPAGVRVAELVAGSGTGATLVKACVVAVTAGGVAAGPSLVDQPGKSDRLTAHPGPAHIAPAPSARSPLDDPAVWSGPAGERRAGPGGSGEGSGDRRSRSGTSGSGSSGSGSGSSGSGSDSSGPGSGGSGSGSDSSGSGSGSSGPGSGSSGSGSSSSGPGSGSSGSDSSSSGPGSSGPGSGSSGSGSPGSGSSPIGTPASSGPSESGSGTSGSGSTGLEPDTSGSGTSGSGTTALEQETSGSGTSGSGTSGSGTSGSG